MKQLLAIIAACALLLAAAGGTGRLDPPLSVQAVQVAPGVVPVPYTSTITLDPAKQCFARIQVDVSVGPATLDMLNGGKPGQECVILALADPTSTDPIPFALGGPAGHTFSPTAIQAYNGRAFILTLVSDGTLWYVAAQDGERPF